jgi:predicted nucleic acid-binding protein
MIVIADTSPINYLILIGHFELLPRLYSEIIIPEAVLRELNDLDTPQLVRDTLSQIPNWLRILPASPVDRALVSTELDDGERDAIALALRLKAELILIDDSAGRLEAKALGLAVTGTLGILLNASKRGVIDLEEALNALSQTTFFASPEILASIRRSARGPEK